MKLYGHNQDTAWELETTTPEQTHQEAIQLLNTVQNNILEAHLGELPAGMPYDIPATIDFLETISVVADKICFGNVREAVDWIIQVGESLKTIFEDQEYPSPEAYNQFLQNMMNDALGCRATKKTKTITTAIKEVEASTENGRVGTWN